MWDRIWELGDHARLAYQPFSVRRNVASILKLIIDGRLDNPERLITHCYPLEKAPEAFEQLERSSGMLGVLLEYPRRIGLEGVYSEL